MKTIILIIIAGLLIVGAVGFYFIQRSFVDCSNVGTLFLKSSEQGLVTNKNIVQSIPEEKKIIGSSEMLKCESYIGALNLNVGNLFG